MSRFSIKPVWTAVTIATLLLSQYGIVCEAATEIIYDFETDDQHRENGTGSTAPGWGSFGTITIDRGPTDDASSGSVARFHSGDFDLPADLPGNFGLVDVADRYLGNRKDFSGYSGLAIDMKFDPDHEALPYTGPMGVQVGFGFIVPGIGEDDSLTVYSAPITLTDTYQTYEIPFDDIPFIQSGAILENDLANNAFIKLRFTNVLESLGRGTLYYDEVYGILDNPPILGDYNLDGTVNAADYTIWRDNENSTTNLAADGNGDLVVDGADYTIWVNNFGQGSVTALAVPEPSTGMMLGLFMSTGIAACRKQRCLQGNA